MGVADDAGDVRVAAYIRADGDVLYRERAALIEPFRLRSRNKSGGVVRGRAHGARYLEVFDCRVVRDPEGSGENRIADVDVKRVSVAVECSDKGVVVAVGRRTRAVAERGRNADVFRQLEVLSAVPRAAAVDMLAERVPVVGGLNEIGFLFGAFALKRNYFQRRVERRVAGHSNGSFVVVLRSAAAVEHDAAGRKNRKQYRRCDNDNRSAYDFYANGFMLHKGSPLCPPRRRKAPGVFVPRSAAKMKSVIRPYQTDATRSYA